MTSLQAIQSMLVEKFDLKLEDLGEDVRIDGLGLDSLSVLEFMFFLEDKFKIDLPAEMLKLETVGDIASVVDKLIAK